MLGVREHRFHIRQSALYIIHNTFQISAFAVINKIVELVYLAYTRMRFIGVIVDFKDIIVRLFARSAARVYMRVGLDVRLGKIAFYGSPIFGFTEFDVSLIMLGAFGVAVRTEVAVATVALFTPEAEIFNVVKAL